MLEKLYLKLLKIIIGKTSIVANVSISGQARMDYGLVFNSKFSKCTPVNESTANNLPYYDFGTDDFIIIAPSQRQSYILDCEFDFA